MPFVFNEPKPVEKQEITLSRAGAVINFHRATGCTYRESKQFVDDNFPLVIDLYRPVQNSTIQLESLMDMIHAYYTQKTR